MASFKNSPHNPLHDFHILPIHLHIPPIQFLIPPLHPRDFLPVS
jgi:hypothetical protein